MKGNLEVTDGLQGTFGTKSDWAAEQNRKLFFEFLIEGNWIQNRMNLNQLIRSFQFWKFGIWFKYSNLNQEL
jgi:hypothetical protein